MIRQSKDGTFTVYSEKGKPFGTYKSREEAMARLKQIERFRDKPKKGK